MSDNRLDIRIYGESHADCIGVVAEGLPAGKKIDMDALKGFLARRAPGQGDWSTPRKEPDLPEFASGLVEKDGEWVTDGRTLEAIIRNTNRRPQDYANVQTVPRPGHADYGSWVKYGHIPSGGGKWSGRMTAPLCIIGGICKQLLAEDGIEIKAHIIRLLEYCDDAMEENSVVREGFPTISERAADSMKKAIQNARSVGDSIGGEIECMITGVKAGVGDALFDGMEAEIARMIFAIPAVKGIEFGTMRECGVDNNDAFVVEDGVVKTATNNCGGILGGISTGMPIVFATKVKPTPSIAIEQDSVDLETMQPVKLKVQGRHDPCILPRAVPVVEAAAAIAIYNLINGE
ncbi:MAG: chorismate synthase [Firmicutes bacterium]|nr:chorismate synthase [Bacillota bacterium]